MTAKAKSRIIALVVVVFVAGRGLRWALQPWITAAVQHSSATPTSQPVHPAMQRVADESTAAVEEWFRHLQDHIEGFTFYDARGDSIKPVAESNDGGQQAKMELRWVNFHKRFGNFVSWAQVDSPANDVLPGAQRGKKTLVSDDTSIISLARDAVLEKGTVKLVTCSRLGGIGKPQVLSMEEIGKPDLPIPQVAITLTYVPR